MGTLSLEYVQTVVDSIMDTISIYNESNASYKRSLIGVGLYDEYPWTADDTIFCIVVPLGGLLILFQLIILFRTIHHIFIEENDYIFHTKVLSTSTIILIFCNCSIWWSGYFTCLYKWCGPNSLGHFQFLSTMDFYITSKLSLYLMIITRLYSTYGKGAYKYPNWVFIIMGIFVFLMIIAQILIHIAVINDMYNEKPHALPIISSIMFGLVDLLLGSITLILFVKPLFKLLKRSQLSMEDEHSSSFFLTIIRYTSLSLITLISNISVGIFMAARFMLGYAHDASTGNPEWDLESTVVSISVLNMLLFLIIIDGFIAIICMAFNLKFGHKYFNMWCKCWYRKLLKRYEISRTKSKSMALSEMIKDKSQQSSTKSPSAHSPSPSSAVTNDATMNMQVATLQDTLSSEENDEESPPFSPSANMSGVKRKPSHAEVILMKLQSDDSYKE